MLNHVKNILGIEGVKISLEVPSTIDAKSKVVEGRLIFSTLRAQTVSAVEVKLVETYSRGRRKKKRSNDYTLGYIRQEEKIKINKDEDYVLQFKMPFVTGQSEMDRYEKKNFLLRGMVKAAKYFRGVKSTFHIEAEAFISGTKLHPFDKIEVELE